MAYNYHFLIADISHQNQLVLEKNYQTDYLLNNFLNSAYFDLKKRQETGGADRLSRKRNLILTIDGVHLNSAGAMLYKQAIEIQINRGSYDS
jgi:lysophospholipase L1-like esterase